MPRTINQFAHIARSEILVIECQIGAVGLEVVASGTTIADECHGNEIKLD